MDARHKPHNPSWIRPPGKKFSGRYPVSSVAVRFGTACLFFHDPRPLLRLNFSSENGKQTTLAGVPQSPLRTRPSGDTRHLARVRQDLLPCACDARPRLRGYPTGRPFGGREYMRRSWPPLGTSPSTQVCGCARRSRAHLRGAGPPCLICTALGVRPHGRDIRRGGHPPPPPPPSPHTPPHTHTHTRPAYAGRTGGGEGGRGEAHRAQHATPRGGGNGEGPPPPSLREWRGGKGGAAGGQTGSSLTALRHAWVALTRACIGTDGWPWTATTTATATLKTAVEGP